MSLQDRFKYDKVGILIGFCIMFMILTFAYSRIIPFEITDDKDNGITARAGATIDICRLVKYDRDVLISMNRAIIRRSLDGMMMTINYPEITFPREKGTKYICRALTIPIDLKNGLYVIDTYITIYSFPFWTNTVEIAKIDLNIRN